MIVLKLPIAQASTENHALNRAITNAFIKKPRIRYCENSSFEVENPEHKLYNLTFTVQAGKEIRFTCDCQAHIGFDKLDPNAKAPTEYIPKICYHAAAVIVSLTEKGRVELAKAHCYRCHATENTLYQRDSDCYECFRCISHDMYGADGHKLQASELTD